MVEYPIFLWVGLIIIPLAISGMLWQERQAKLLIKQLGLVEKLINLDTQTQRLRYLARVGVVVCLLIALSRPKWGVAEQIIISEGIGVVWVLDVSRSMDVQDIAPSRLERAKLMMNIVMENNSNHQFGAVMFAEKSWVQFPLTLDTSSAIGIVQSINTDAISDQGTDIVNALQVALKMLDQRMIASGTVILLSDGEHNRQFDDLDHVINEANQRDIAIYTVGYGTHEGNSIPDGKGDFIRDANGEQIISRLEDQLLSDISKRTGGIYQVAMSTAEEVAFVQQTIDAMNTEEFERRSQLDYIPRFPLFLVLTLGLLVIDGLVGNGKKHPIFDDISDFSL
jgi:Ca-activated chloride channel family protein